MPTMTDDWVRVGTVEEVAGRGCSLVLAPGRAIAVFAVDGAFHAMDNRCPHMGFPLSRGTLRDGILTCHWHHARFDVTSGGTLDPFADDAPAFDTEVRDGAVWVCTRPRVQDALGRTLRRIEEGLREDIGLVLAKGAVALRAAAVGEGPGGDASRQDSGSGGSAGARWLRPALKVAAGFGCRQRAGGWASGMTILTAMANVAGALAPAEQPLALYHGLVHVARDCDGQPPLVPQRPLAGSRAGMAELTRWLRRCVEVRDEDGARRVVLTALERGAGPAEAAAMTFAAATDHLYLSGGHALDFLNKAFELLELIGWEEAATVLPAALIPVCRASRAEEAANWRQPVDLVEVVGRAWARAAGDGRLAAALEAAPSGPADELVPVLLGEDPAAGAQALVDALLDGRAPADLAQALAYAAALRMAHFPTSNEFGDWIAVLHTFTYCNALHQALLRAPTAELCRGLLHGAMAVYLDRFLNVPPARLPEPDTSGDGFPQAFLALLDAQQQVEPAARMVASRLARSDDGVIATLGRAVLREDAEFHTYQTLEAAWRQYGARRGTGAGGHILVAAARYIAAHAPTPRAMLRTAEIAERLHRGEALFAEA
jgi:nitrite reductase/ring-hydroxylating ferredoxin subunit